MSIGSLPRLVIDAELVAVIRDSTCGPGQMVRPRQLLVTNETTLRSWSQSFNSTHGYLWGAQLRRGVWAPHDAVKYLRQYWHEVDQRLAAPAWADPQVFAQGVVTVHGWGLHSPGALDTNGRPGDHFLGCGYDTSLSLEAAVPPTDEPRPLHDLVVSIGNAWVPNTGYVSYWHSVAEQLGRYDRLTDSSIVWQFGGLAGWLAGWPGRMVGRVGRVGWFGFD